MSKINNRRRNLLITVPSYAFIAFGAMVVGAAIYNWVYKGLFSINDIIISFTLILLGIGGFLYKSYDYKGGATTIAGVILIIFSVFLGIMALFNPDIRSGENLHYTLFYIALFIICGLALTRYGHKKHISLNYKKFIYNRNHK